MRDILHKYKISLFTTFLILLTCVSFLPSLRNGWTSWDDNVYVTDNADVREISPETLSNVWTKHYVGSYVPLTMMSYMLDYRIAEYTPAMYHATNLLLHCINAILVFWFVYVLLGKQFIAAGISSLVFAVHPMHVESVAWISGRKDLLSTMFILLCLIAYLQYVENEKKKWLLSAFLFFVFALFSKVIAIVIPLIVVLIDYFRKRSVSKEILFEKIPFLIVAIVFAVIGYFAQTFGHAVRQTSIVDSFWVSQYAVVFYNVKFFTPLSLSALYPYPSKVHGAFPLEIYLASVFLIALLYLLWRNRRNDALVFGFVFFLLFVLPVLQLVRFSSIVAADRFTYVSYIGLMVPISVWLQEYFSRQDIRARAALLIVVFFGIFACSYLSYERCLVWNNSTTLWMDVLKQFPNALN